MEQVVLAFGTVSQYAQNRLGQKRHCRSRAADYADHGLAETDLVEINCEITGGCVHHKKGKIEKHKRNIRPFAGIPGKHMAASFLSSHGYFRDIIIQRQQMRNIESKNDHNIAKLLTVCLINDRKKRRYPGVQR